MVLHCNCILVFICYDSIKVVRTLRAEELARDVEGLAADDDDLLTAEKLLRDDAGESTEKVTLAVNDDLEHENISLCSW